MSTQTKKQTKPAQKKTDGDEKTTFTPEEAVAYFTKKRDYWQGKVGRLIHPPKVARAKRRLSHYETKLADAQAALVAGE